MILQPGNLDLPIDELVTLSFTAQQLSKLQSMLAAETADTKRRKETFDALLERIYGDKVRAAYKVAQKDTGVVRIAASNTLNLKVDVDKTVKWDQQMMRQFRDKMTEEERAHFIKETLEVEEKKFTAAPPTIKAVLTKARTVKPGKMKFTFTEAETENV